MATNLYTDPSTQVTTYTQPTATPTAKVKAVGYAGIVTTVVPLLVALVAAFNANINPDAAEIVANQIVALIGAIITMYNIVSSAIQFLAGYFKKSDTANGTQH